MTENNREGRSLRSSVIHAAARLFLQKGYQSATMREIAAEAGVKYGSVCFCFKTKEAILCELVSYVLEGQFNATRRLLCGVTDDKLLLYAAETTLQLYMAESSEQVREIYSAAYSLPNSSAIIYHAITEKLEDIFGEHLPHWETKDFFEREIATGGIMRGYMSLPCDMYFTIERKVRAFLESALLIYRVPDARIAEAIEFVSRYDWGSIARGVIGQLLSYLEEKI